MLFAAGYGNRMRHLTADRPKPLVEVAGKALIDHALELTIDLGPHVVNVHYKAEQLVEHLKSREVVISDETTDLLETGGGLRKALPLLGASPVITINTDAVWVGPNPITQLLSSWSDNMEGLLMLVPPRQAIGHKGHGDFRSDAHGRLQRGPDSIYSGLQMIRTETLQEISETSFSLNMIWDQMIARGTLYGIDFSGKWCDVGRPESIPLAEAMIAGRDV